MNDSSEARELHPYIDYGNLPPASPHIKDFRPMAVKADSPDPKEESVLESARSSKSQTSDEPTGSGATAPTPASKESGQDSNLSDGSTQSQDTTTLPKMTELESSLQASSEPTSPGWPTPPVPVALPISE